MFTETEAKDWLKKGENRAMNVFVEGHVDIPEKAILDLPDVPLSDALVVDLVNSQTGETTRAKKSDIRKAKSIAINPEQLSQYWDIWTGCEGFIREWHSKFPQYFDTWGTKGGELVRYEKGDYFKIHRDAPSRTRRETPITEKEPLEYRGVIVCIGLSDKDGYEGGELVFPSENRSFKLGKGDVLVFPGVMLHYLTEIEEGERYIIFGGAFCRFTSNANLDLYSAQFDRE